MKHLIAIVIMLITIQLHADGFKVIVFNHVPNDISAITNNYKRLDDNDEVCAIIKVRSDIKNLRFTASNPVVGKVDFINGEYWVYISGGTRQLSFFTEGFIKFSYNFPQDIEKAKVYILELSSTSGSNLETGKGTLIITSTPENIKVGIDGFPDIEKQTPYSFENYRIGKYRFKFYRNRYHSLDSIIMIEKNTQKQINIFLKPTWGNLIVSTNNIDAKFEIDGRIYSGSNLELTGEIIGLKPGNYKLKISKPNHIDSFLDISIIEGETTYHTVSFVPVTSNINITSSPSGADIFIDEKYVGSSPQFIDNVIIGSHSIKISHNTYIDEVRTVILEEKRNINIDITLRNNTNIVIESNPSGAEVRINGNYKGKTPIKIDVITGDKTLNIQKDNYISINKIINIKSADTYRYNLEKQKYQLKIQSNPAEANVTINGVKKGVTPQQPDLNYGKYKVTVTKDKYTSDTKRINLKKNEIIKFNLTKQFQGYFGILFVPEQSEYSTIKFGLELGWTYKKAKQFLTGFGYYYGYVDDIETEIPSGVDFINAGNYTGLNLNSLKSDGFAEQKVNSFLVRVGYVLSKPYLVLSASAGMYMVTGYDVYIADKDYNTNNGYDIYSGDKFINSDGKEDASGLVYGLGILIPWGNLYISGDYWVSYNLENFGPQFMIGIGYSIK